MQSGALVVIFSRKNELLGRFHLKKIPKCKNPGNACNIEKYIRYRK